MDWIDLKTRVRELLLSRGLSNPAIRLNALNKLEGVIRLNFPEIYKTPSALLQIDQNDFKKQLSKFKKLNSAETSVINNFYQIISGDAKIVSPLDTIKKTKRTKTKKPTIYDYAEEMVSPIYGLEPLVNKDTRIVILGTFPAKESLNAGYYYQNQKKRFWGQALGNTCDFENRSNEERISMLLERRIGLWDIFECVERKDSNQDSDIISSKYNDFNAFLSEYISIKTFVFNGKNAFEWFSEDHTVLSYKYALSIVKLQSTSGSNRHFNNGKDWHQYFKSAE